MTDYFFSPFNMSDQTSMPYSRGMSCRVIPIFQVFNWKHFTIHILEPHLPFSQLFSIGDLVSSSDPLIRPPSFSFASSWWSSSLWQILGETPTLHYRGYCTVTFDPISITPLLRVTHFLYVFRKQVKGKTHQSPLQFWWILFVSRPASDLSFNENHKSLSSPLYFLPKGCFL